MAIREILLHISVLVISFGAFLNPLIGLFGYIWYSLARPDALAWVEARYPHSLIIAIATLLGAWRYLPNLNKWLRNPWVISVILLQAPMLLSVFAAPNVTIAWEPYKVFFKYLVMALLIPLFVVTLKDYRYLMFTIAFSVGLIGFRFGVFGLRSGGVHLESGLGGFMSDNNTLALAFNMGLPFIWHCRGIVEKQWRKNAVYIAFFTTIVGILITHSRGGILTLGLVLAIIVMRSRRKLAVLLVAGTLSLPGLLLMADSLARRMQTLENVDEDGSATARIAYAKTALRVWKDYPLLGVGFGTYNWTIVSEKYQMKARAFHVVHNNYLQMAVDSGTFAFLILVWQIFFGLYWTGRSARLMKKIRPDLVCYPYALEGALAAFAVGSLFVSRTDYDFYYYLILAIGAWYTVHTEIAAEYARKTAERALQARIGGSSPETSSAPGLLPGSAPTEPHPAFVPRFRSPNSPIRTSSRMRNPS
jgi:probable O-glycosylation ligase (exosortase A-associated)